LLCSLGGNTALSCGLARMPIALTVVDVTLCYRRRGARGRSGVEPVVTEGCGRDERPAVVSVPGPDAGNPTLHQWQ